MVFDDGQTEALPEPWFLAGAALRAALEAELRRELAPGHALFGATVAAVAKCGACDEAAFAVEGEPGAHWARVHLTWTGHREVTPYPRSEEFAALGSCVASHQH